MTRIAVIMPRRSAMPAASITATTFSGQISARP